LSAAIPSIVARVWPDVAPAVLSLKGTFGGRVDPQFRRGTASSERLAVAVAANPVAIGVQAVRIAVAVVNRDSVANIGAVKVRWRRRQAVIRVSRVATLLRGWRPCLTVRVPNEQARDLRRRAAKEYLPRNIYQGISTRVFACRDGPLLTAGYRQSVPQRAHGQSSAPLLSSMMPTAMRWPIGVYKVARPTALGSSAQAIGRWGPGTTERLCRTPRPSFGYAATPASPASTGSRPTGSGLTPRRCATSTLTSSARYPRTPSRRSSSHAIAPEPSDSEEEEWRHNDARPVRLRSEAPRLLTFGTTIRISRLRYPSCLSRRAGDLRFL
jgi:hypothetical protein